MNLKSHRFPLQALPLSLSVFALLAISACAEKSVNLLAIGPGQREVIPLVGTIKVNRYTLSNGLRLLVVEDHTSPTFAYQTWFRVGSRDELVNYTGLAHLFEHLMFKATSNHPEGEFDKILEAAGAEGENAFTNRDYTAYVQELPKKNLNLIAELEADRMTNLVVNDASFKTEREVVQNERRYRNENSPDGLMYQEIFGLAFDKHPYHWPVIGYEADLNRMTAQTPEDFYHSYYSPNHATIIVVGDFEPDEVYKTIQKRYGKIQAQNVPTHEIPPEPEQTTPRGKTLRLNIQVEKLNLAYRIPEITHSDIPKIAVLQSILTGGKSSRLSRALVDSGICSSVDSYDLEDKDPSLLIFMANSQQKHTATQAKNVILAEIQKLVLKGVNPKELERAKNKLSFDFYEGLDSNSQKANFLGRMESLGQGFELGLKIQKEIQNVTATDVQLVAKKYLDPKTRTVIIGVRK